MKLKQRLYEDYLKKSRLPEYRKLLLTAQTAGYQMVGILQFFKMVKEKEQLDRILINRHDIDTSPKVARQMFEIEKEIYGKNGSATYYFRNSTMDKHLIKELDEYGYETGYHYEELAIYEKKHKLKL